MTRTSGKSTGAAAERVRRAAVTLFSAKGFNGTGIRDLAGEAQLSSASLYHYMGTKEDLLVEIMSECLGNLLTAAELAIVDVSHPAERLGRLVALHVLAHAVQPDETQVVDNEVRALSPTARQGVVALRDSYEQLWAEAIDEGLTSGAFRTGNPTVTRLALLEMCSGVARWYSPDGALDLGELAGHYAELAMRAVDCHPEAPPDLAHCRAVVSRVWGLPA